MKFITETFKGTRRSSNKDGILVHEIQNSHWTLFNVFDGISSLPNAKHGVNMAINYIENCAHSFMLSDKPDLVSLLYNVNGRVCNSKYEKPYTTVTTVAVNKYYKTAVLVANIGDTRAYEITNNYMKSLTCDQRESLNIVKNYIGKQDMEQADIYYSEHTLPDHCKLLLCSDGFYNLMEHDKMNFFEKINQKRLGVIKQSLYNIVKGKNNDDATYILVDMTNV